MFIKIEYEPQGKDIKVFDTDFIITLEILFNDKYCTLLNHYDQNNFCVVSMTLEYLKFIKVDIKTGIDFVLNNYRFHNSFSSKIIELHRKKFENLLLLA